MTVRGMPLPGRLRPVKRRDGFRPDVEQIELVMVTLLLRHLAQAQPASIVRGSSEAA
ncbi:hypothetical protein NTJ56_34825 [Burkholderia contaminans]|uniref:hypothetical protein n=1 Tax=Burkholderia contaminans TaxID=488447 RepID=UPI001CF0D9AF|nr:hypothetical protein [Burkholderia contaminans]MCA7917653.1 hypothetical protein [Burkholderia contaminans]UUX42793.1 hypothetical protein NTJ56_34825 [Burkholderia contaminans]